LRRWLAVCSAFLACALEPAAAQDPAPGPRPPADAATASEKLPSFAELEAAGATVGEIRLDNRDIFDMEDPRENSILYRAANALHIRTRREVIQRKLLVKSGERVSVHLIEETERLLRSSQFVYDVSIRPVAYHDGVVDIEVRTRDTWTLQPGVSAGREGGSNRRGITLRENNALGTGVQVGVERSSEFNRTGTEYRITDNHAFDGWTTVDFGLTQFNDGERKSFSLARPFYALDTRWAAGFTGSKDDRIESVYTNGVIAGQYRHKQDKAEVVGGLSKGLVGGWVHRYSAGLGYSKDTYSLDPTLPAPVQLPQDLTLVTPFLRYELVQDSYEKLKNRDLIERPEYFLMGWQSQVQLGRALTGPGSTNNFWLYSASASDGLRFSADQTMLTAASINGQSGYGPLDNQLLSGSIRYYGHQRTDSLLFASLAGDNLRDSNPANQLLLGGDTGLRGYPRNYQAGNRRVLFNLEERVYTDWYPFRLFRVGAAMFYDLGRAWSGPTENTANTDWLSDVGFGLRILSARASFGKVTHIDLAFPLNRDPSIKRVQFLVTTKVTL
jgi:outer membrane protein assembly factor BamA